jgi:ABC-type nickel/cobalt efflux system permease component RcnA
MSLGRRVAAALVAAPALMLLAPGSASAHPLGNFTTNVYAGIELRAGHVHVDYVVDMAEVPTFQLLPSIDVDRSGTADEAELIAWVEAQAPRLAADLSIAIDDRAIPVTASIRSAELGPGQGGLPTLRIELGLDGRIPEEGTLTFADRSFPGRLGWREVTANGLGGTVIADSSVPVASLSARLTAYPADRLGAPLDVRTATVTYGPGAVPEGRAGTGAGPDATGRSAAAGFGDARLADLVAGSRGWVHAAALALAVAIGALHALGPGHGKTLLAAYVVGSAHRPRDTSRLALAVAAMHTVSVLALGGLVLSAASVFPVERVYALLGLLSGIVAVALGSALLATRVRSRRAHVPGLEPHGHEHVPARAAGRSPRGSLVAIALAGGAVPSPSALLILLASVSLGRVPFGLALVAAFGVGLAATLVLVGAVAARTRRLLERRAAVLAHRFVPIGSAAGVVVLGVAMTARGIAQV